MLLWKWCGIDVAMSVKEIYLSLGSNQGDSLDYLLRAILALAKSIIIRDCSSIYVTEPIGNVEQADFLNIVIRGETELEPLHLLKFCQEIEEQLQRVRTKRWGPRTIDIDLLFIGREQILHESLIVPHPRLTERAFVLAPLREISPDKYAELAVQIPPQKIILHLAKSDVTMMLEERGLKLNRP